ncbi:MAG: hypothetical protein ABEJ40_11465 [Haloarculaceae archaeon]
MTTRVSTAKLLGRMVREEWRLHAELFGDRFGVFPVAVAAMAAAGVWLLTLTDTSLATVAAGLHALVFFFGLQVGTIGLVGRDALRDVLGDVTLLVFSARTLPVTWRRLLAVFLLKDLLYYSALFLAPVAVGYAAVALAGGAPAASVALLWVTTTAAFGLGVGASLTLAGLATRNRALAAAAVLAVLVVLLTGRVNAVALSPLAFYEAPSVGTALSGFAPAAALLAVGPLLFEPADGGPSRTASDRYGRYRDILGDGVATRTVLEVAGSSGSVWKVLFSMGVLFVVTAVLVTEVARATTLDPSMGVAVGTLLGLGAFTTYSWVTQFDDAAEYRRYPLGMERVFAGKLRAYLVLSVPAGLVYLLGSLVWVPVAEVVVGAVVFPLVAVYVFGVTAYVTGLSPNELLFDTPLFAAFGAALAAVALPLVVAGLVHTEAPTLATVGALGVAVLGAAVGVLLLRLAGPRWDDRSRAR